MQSNNASGSRAIRLVAAPTPTQTGSYAVLLCAIYFSQKQLNIFIQKKVTESHPEDNFVTQKETQANTAKHFRR